MATCKKGLAEVDEDDKVETQKEERAESAGYVLVETASGCAVKREDGALAHFLDRLKAIEARDNLASGEESDKDYDWAECIATDHGADYVCGDCE